MIDVIYTDAVITFPEYLLSKIQEFEKGKGRRTSLDAFAEFIGVSRPLISQWLSGRTKPSLENVKLFAIKYGSEVYDVLGLPSPDPDLQALSVLWPHLTEEARHTLREQGEKFAEQNDQPSTLHQPVEKTA